MTAAETLKIVDNRLYNTESEEGVIASLLVNPVIVDHIADRLAVEDFFDPFLGYTYGTIVREFGLGKPLNPITIRHYLEIHNANPRPFAWSKSADEILASVERFCTRVRNASE